MICTLLCISSPSKGITLSSSLNRTFLCGTYMADTLLERDLLCRMTRSLLSVTPLWETYVTYTFPEVRIE